MKSGDLRDPQPVESFLTISGRRLHLLDWGGDGQPILIVHATGFLARVYDPIALALRDTGHVFAYDQAGHGDSDPLPPDAISWFRTADELEALLLAMNLHDVRAFGHSAGATAIATVAARRPDLISRAVLVEPVIVDPHDPQERPNDLYDRTLKRKPSFDSLDAMLANFSSKPPYSEWRPDVLRNYCEYGSRAESDVRRTLKCTPETEARLYQTARDFDGLSRFLAMTIPALIVFGGDTNSPGIDFAARLEAGVTNRRTLTIPGRGHLAPMEDPAAIAALTCDFLAQ